MVDYRFNRVGLLDSLFNWLDKLLNWIERLWSNPTWNCKKCQHRLSTYSYFYLKHKSGFNKYHTHKLKEVYKYMARKCKDCDNYLSNYDFKDLGKFSLSKEIHYAPKEGAKSIAQKEKERQVAGNYAIPNPAAEIGQWYWHVHHQVLAEQLTEPIQNRIDYIKYNKADAPETRLHFMRPVKNVPTIVTQGTEAKNRADAVYKSVSKAYNKNTASYAALVAARKKLDKVTVSPTDIRAAWEAQHKKECFHYCPWDGKTLIPAVAQGKR